MSATPRIQAVTFDVGGTLIEPWPSVGHVYAEVATRHGQDALSAQVLSERFKRAWRSCPEFDYTRAGWEKLVEQTFEGLVDSSAPFFPELYERFAETDVWRIFNDVKPTLEALAASDIRLAVISNWDERLRGLLEKLRLRGYFETLIISCEVGFTKPSSVIFEQAAARLGLAPETMLHVGDSLELDFRGARAAGFQARHLARGKSVRTSEVIDSLAEITRLVAN